MESSFFTELPWEGAKEEIGFKLKILKVTLLKGQVILYVSYFDTLSTGKRNFCF